MSIKIQTLDFDDIRQYVGYQENKIIDGDNNIDVASIVYLTMHTSEDNQFALSIEKANVICEYNETGIQEKILELFDQFPKFKIKPFTGNDKDCYYTYVESQVKNKIAQQTRRGCGNTKFGNTLFYKGSNDSDCPIIVAKKGNLYGIFKHPNFDQYGFNLQLNN